MNLTYIGVVAMAENRAIGLNNAIPWKLPEDMKLFRRITMGHPVFMGRRTWESLGRALPGRQNIVLSRTPGYRAEGADVISCPEELSNLPLQHEEVMVIGGAGIYALMLPRMTKLYVSEVKGTYEADVWFPSFKGFFSSRTELEHFEGFDLVLYER